MPDRWLNLHPAAQLLIYILSIATLIEVKNTKLFAFLRLLVAVVFRLQPRLKAEKVQVIGLILSTLGTGEGCVDRPVRCGVPRHQTNAGHNDQLRHAVYDAWQHAL